MSAATGIILFVQRCDKGTQYAKLLLFQLWRANRRQPEVLPEMRSCRQPFRSDYSNARPSLRSRAVNATHKLYADRPVILASRDDAADSRAVYDRLATGWAKANGDSIGEPRRFPSDRAGRARDNLILFNTFGAVRDNTAAAAVCCAARRYRDTRRYTATSRAARAARAARSCERHFSDQQRVRLPRRRNYYGSEWR